MTTEEMYAELYELAKRHEHLRPEYAPALFVEMVGAGVTARLAVVHVQHGYEMPTIVLARSGAAAPTIHDAVRALYQRYTADKPTVAPQP